MPDTLRAFIALPIPDAATAFIGRIQERLRPSLDAVRWVPPANIHLTLAFLGEIDPSAVAGIAARMDVAAGEAAPLWLAAGGVGGFPSLRQARVLWVGLTGDLERLRFLQAALASHVEALGLRRESKPFRAHLTIGRLRRRIDPRRLAAALEPCGAVASASFRVDRLHLLRSELKSSGAVYSGLHTAMLGGAEPPADKG